MRLGVVMRIKDHRWYVVRCGVLFIFDEPFENTARTVSIVNINELAYYRSTFKLEKAWG